MNVLNYLLDNDFNSEDLKKAFGFVYDNRESVKIIQTFDENITINEGAKLCVIYRHSYNKDVSSNVI